MDRLPPDVDTTVASPARIYDHLLGGKDNFAVDREAAAHVIRHYPQTEAAARDNRAFLGRAVRYLAVEHGIRRFLDIGSGLPTQENVHQVAKAVDSRSHVVYVDHDPVAVSHARALMAGVEGVTAIQADLREHGDLLARPEVRDLLAPGEPVGLLMVAILHFFSDDDDPYRIVTEVAARMPAGSLLVLSHATADADPRGAEEAERVYRASSALTVRGHKEILGFFDGMELVDPGLAWTLDWRATDPVADPVPGRKGFYAGVAKINSTQ